MPPSGALLPPAGRNRAPPSAETGFAWWLRQAERFSKAFAWAGGAAVLGAALLIVAEVATRVLLNRAISGVEEISGYVLAIGSAWAFAYALVTRAHVRIDTLYLMLPVRIRPWFDLVALLAMGFFAATLCYRAGELLSLSIAFGSRSMSPLQVPLWIPQSFWVFGLAFFLAVIVLMTLRLVLLLCAGRAALAAQVAGLDSIDAELAGELADADHRRTMTKD